LNIALEPRGQTLRLHLQEGDLWRTYDHEGRAQNVLEFLYSVLEKQDMTIDDVSALGVVMEGESFTATRILTVVSNTLGFMKDISIRSLTQEFAQGNDEQKSEYWDKAEGRAFIMPKYSGEPTITLEKLKPHTQVNSS